MTWEVWSLVANNEVVVLLCLCGVTGEKSESPVSREDLCKLKLDLIHVNFNYCMSKIQSVYFINYFIPFSLIFIDKVLGQKDFS